MNEWINVHSYFTIRICINYYFYYYNNHNNDDDYENEIVDDETRSQSIFLAEQYKWKCICVCVRFKREGRKFWIFQIYRFKFIDMKLFVLL